LLIGWKKDQFRLVDKLEVNHEDLSDRFTDFSIDFKRGNVGLICLLEHIKTNTLVLVANTHIHWNSKFDHVKYA
jgi:mRNA deadenylase 3'-5' endonuclease subunit Ccr4